MKFKRQFLKFTTILSLFVAPVALADDDDDDGGGGGTKPPVSMPEGGSVTGLFFVTVAAMGLAAWKLKKK